MGLPKILIFEVTQDDIDNGIRTSARKCPVARAINRAVGKGYWGRYFARVSSRVITVGYDFYDPQIDSRPAYYKSSDELLKYVNDFDLGEKIEPKVFAIFRKD